MAQPVPADLRIGIAEPQDAVQAFRQRKLLSPTFRWTDLWLEEHAHAFTVAKLLDLELLGWMRDELDAAIAEGHTAKQFARRVQPRLQEAGWWGRVEVVDPETGEVGRTRVDPARLQLIYDTNVRQSHAAGRWERITRGASRAPYVRYRTMRDERVRLSHQAWHGVTLPVDDPFWDTHYPPNGYRCRCLAFPVSQVEIQKLRAAGQKVTLQAPPINTVPYVNRTTGETLFTPAGVDPGFGYNPGKARALSLAEVMQRKAKAVLSPEQASRELALWITSEPQMRAFGAWVDAVLTASRPAGAAGLVRPVGFIGAAESAYLQRRGKTVPEAPIELRNELLVGAKQARHQAAGNALDAADWKAVPAALAQPIATLYDTETGRLVYVADSPDGRNVKLAVAVGDQVRRGTVRNELRSGFKVQAVDLAADIKRGKYLLIDGSVE